MRRVKCLTGGLVVALRLMGPACGDDGDDEPAAPEAANGNAQSEAQASIRSSCAKARSPGFVPTASAFTAEGVDAFAEYARLSPAEVQQLRENGFARSPSGGPLLVVTGQA